MTCKLCGKNLIGPQEKEELPQWRLDLRKEMEDMSCDELYRELTTSSIYYRYVEAKRCLVERGHDEVFLR